MTPLTELIFSQEGVPVHSNVLASRCIDRSLPIPTFTGGVDAAKTVETKPLNLGLDKTRGQDQAISAIFWIVGGIELPN
jgi:hypothetical protein